MSGIWLKCLACIAAAMLVCPGFAWSDACQDVADMACGGLTTGSDHTTHGGYVCTEDAINEDSEDWVDVRDIDKVWEEGDVNCGCDWADATYTLTRSRTNTHKVDVSGTFSFEVGTSAGVDLAEIVKAEASTTASWEASAGYGYEATRGEDLEAQGSYRAQRCSEWSYKKWYWVGTVNGTADLVRSWSDTEWCMGPSGMTTHRGSATYPDAITASGRGWDLFDGTYDGEGQGFQNWDVRCEKCGTSTYCYKYECPEDPCGSCE